MKRICRICRRGGNIIPFREYYSLREHSLMPGFLPGARFIDNSLYHCNIQLQYMDCQIVRISVSPMLLLLLLLMLLLLMLPGSRYIDANTAADYIAIKGFLYMGLF